jgi:MSHA biogenesis protein MshP
MRSKLRRIRGFALVSAIFILVVLAALGAFIVNISTSQQIGSALDVQGVRAYQAARAGIEWGLYQVQSTANYNFSYGTPVVAVGSASANLRHCPGGGISSTDSFVPAATTMSAFVVTVTCTETTDGATGGPSVYNIVATACNQPNAAEPKCPNITAPGNLYIERRLSVVF